MSIELEGALESLGFSGSEAKAYLALLQHGVQNGYQLAKTAHVPRSAIYDTLGRLIERGAIMSIADQPGAFIAVPGTEMLDRLRREKESQFQTAEKELARLTPLPERDVIARIAGDAQAINVAKSLIAHSHNSLTLSLWEDHYRVLEPVISEAVARGVLARTVLFSKTQPKNLGNVYLHHFINPEVVEARLDTKLVVIAVDHQEVLVAGFVNPGTHSWAVRTTDRAIVLVSEEYIRHDIILAALTEHIGADVLENLWRSRPDLVSMVTGQEWAQSPRPSAHNS